MDTAHENEAITRLRGLTRIPGVVEIPEDIGIHFQLGEWHVHFHRCTFTFWKEIGDGVVVKETLIAAIPARRSPEYVVLRLNSIDDLRAELAPGSREEVFLSHIRGIIATFWTARHGPALMDPL